MYQANVPVLEIDDVESVSTRGAYGHLRRRSRRPLDSDGTCVMNAQGRITRAHELAIVALPY